MDLETEGGMRGEGGEKNGELSVFERRVWEAVGCCRCASLEANVIDKELRNGGCHASADYSRLGAPWDYES